MMKSLSILVLLLLLACQATLRNDESTSIPSRVTVPPEQFNDYWYSGTGEISTYRLEQSRYGQLNEGTATLVFVSEPFLPTQQVKDETGHEESVTVLKLNMVKKFITGLYPYSMMLSTFTPIDVERYPQVLKLTESSQEWCGQTFTQFNLRNRQYEVVRYSYFEAEGDQQRTFPAIILEDELWSRLRLNPESLPTGEFQLIQGAFFTRLSHQPLSIQNVQATRREATFQEEAVMEYAVYFPELDRDLRIYYRSEFPYAIVGWEETYEGISFGNESARLTTTATLLETLQTDYWNKNQNEHRALRSELGLDKASE